jgi:hypothetical protein
MKIVTIQHSVRSSTKGQIFPRSSLKIWEKAQHTWLVCEHFSRIFRGEIGKIWPFQSYGGIII